MKKQISYFTNYFHFVCNFKYIFNLKNKIINNSKHSESIKTSKYDS